MTDKYPKTINELELFHLYIDKQHKKEIEELLEELHESLGEGIYFKNETLS